MDKEPEVDDACMPLKNKQKAQNNSLIYLKYFHYKYIKLMLINHK